MDPVTAIALAIAEVAKLWTEILKDQPPEMRRQGWEDWGKFLAFMQGLHHR